MSTNQNMKKVYLSVVTVFFVFALLNIAGFFFAPHGRHFEVQKEGSFAGKIIRYDSELLIVENIHAETRSFVLTPETFFVEGREQVTSSVLEVGTFVFVTGEENKTSSTTNAREVRIMKTDVRKNH